MTYFPQRLAEWQLARDRKLVLGSQLGPELGARLFARKQARMRVSPFAFLRGAAPLFYEMLRADAELARGPRGRGWIVGDLHLENFGAYRREALGTKSKASKVVFGLNDYDDAVVAPFRWDVLRLTASVILADRELGCDGVRAVELCRELVDAYVESACHGGPALGSAKPVRALLAQVKSRTRHALLEARTEIVGGQRRFVRGERYFDLPPTLRKRLPRALDTFVASLEPAVRPTERQMAIVDAAVRVAGTGSLGSVRIAVLVAGHGDVDGGWIFDLKQERAPAAAALAPPDLPPNDRVVAGASALAAHASRSFGATWLGELPMLVRRLAPQEDKLDLRQLAAATLPGLVRSLGAIVGDAHARAAGAPLPVWSQRSCEKMIDRALVMAGLHEAVYLAYCKAIA